MKIDGKIVANELRSLRAKKKLSAEYISKKVNIHSNSLYKYENDASLLKLDVLIKILECYDTNVFIFFKNISENIH
jgi:transcriptional regulator with XRE-family HTH domain